MEIFLSILDKVKRLGLPGLANIPQKKLPGTLQTKEGRN
jgi:hypothetical protein